MISPADDTRTREQNGNAGSAPPYGRTPASNETSGTPHPLDPLLQQIAMVRAFALHYVEAQKDAIKSSARRLAIKTMLGVAGAIVGVTALVACTVMVFDALAELVSLAAGGHQWVGNLVVGGGVLIVTGMVAALYLARWMRTTRDSTIHKYESRHDVQRKEFGADVTSRAAR
jgi:hypothetical protein